MNNNLATKNQDDYTITPQGAAYVTSRKSAEMVGMSQNAVNNYFGSRNIVISQGLNPENLAVLVQHYATKGRPEAVAMLVKFARAGAKAYIYHEAGYVMEAKRADGTPQTFAQALRLAADQQEQIEKDALKIAQDQPKVFFADHVINEGSAILVGDFAKLLSNQFQVNIGQNRLFQYLRGDRLLMSGKNGFNKNSPYQKYIDKGWFTVKYHQRKNQDKYDPTPYVTGLGQVELSERIVDHFRADQFI